MNWRWLTTERPVTLLDLGFLHVRAMLAPIDIAFLAAVVIVVVVF